MRDIREVIRQMGDVVRSSEEIDAHGKNAYHGKFIYFTHVAGMLPQEAHAKVWAKLGDIFTESERIGIVDARSKLVQDLVKIYMGVA